MKAKRALGWSRDGLSLAVAFGVHAVLVAAIQRAPSASTPQVSEEVAVLELEIVTLEEQESAALPRSVPGDLTGVGAAAKARPAPLGPRGALVQETQDPLPVAPSDPSAGGVESSYAVDPRAPSDAPRKAVSFALPWIGGGGVGSESGPRPTAGVSPPGPREEAGEGLRRSLAREHADRDRRVGVGPGSEVAGLVIPAVRTAGAPDGWAVVDVELDAGGRLRGVSVRDSDTAGWGPAIEAVKAALAGRAIKLPESYRGARVRLKLVARFRLPNGQKNHIEPIRPFEREAEPGREEAAPTTPRHARWWDALGPRTDARVLPKDPPSVAGLPLNTSLMLPMVRFDPSTIGARRALVVGASVMDVIPL